MPALPTQLGKPTLAMLPRVVDQLGFLYIEATRIEKDDNGVSALTWTSGQVQQDQPPPGAERTPLPTAALAAVLMGPGSSITQAAAIQIMRDGCTVVMVGAVFWTTAEAVGSQPGTGPSAAI